MTTVFLTIRVGAACAAVTVCLFAAKAAADTLSVREYAATLRAAAERVQQESFTRADGITLAEELDAITVRLPDGTRVAPEHDATLAILRDRKSYATHRRGDTMETVAAQLAHHAAQAERLAHSGAAADRGRDAHQLLSGVLDNLQYRPPPASRSLLDFFTNLKRRLVEFLEALFAAILKFFQGEPEPHTEDSWSMYVWLAVALVVTGGALGLVVVWIKRLIEAKLAAYEPRDDVATPWGVVRTPSFHTDEARRLMDAGDYQGAVRALYLRLLADLSRLGAVKLHPSFTNGDYVRALGVAEARRAMRAASHVFDVIWYGHHAATRTHCDDLMRYATATCNAVSGRHPRGRITP